MVCDKPGVAFPDKATTPGHNVTIDYDFAVGRDEVTGPQWLQCVNEHGCPADLGYKIDPFTRSPVEFISYSKATAFVTWLSKKTGRKYRLLTEAEWEYAARAGTKTSFYWGDNMTGTLPAVCWGCGGDTDGSKTNSVAPIERYAPNGFGLYDMAGNVAVLVQDCWSPDYTDAPDDGSATRQDGCSLRILRGGGYRDPPLSLRSFARISTYGDDSGQEVGFRVATDLD